MTKLTLGDLIRDLNLLEDHWTFCAKWPWTAKSEACVARTPADIRAAEARGLESLIDVGLARALIHGMEPPDWMSHIVHHAEQVISFRARRRPRFSKRRLAA